MMKSWIFSLLTFLMISKPQLVYGNCEIYFSISGVVKMHYIPELGGRYSRPMDELASQKLVVAIPGGPAISGRYMDGFIAKLSESLGINYGTLNLPNHDEEFGSHTILSFQTGVDALADKIRLLHQVTGEPVTYLAHSYGAFLLLAAMLEDPSLPIETAILLNIPMRFKRAQAYSLKAEHLNIAESESIETEEEFASYWHKILPLYFESSDEKILETFKHEPTFFKGNEGFEVDQPQDIFGLKNFSKNVSGLRQTLSVIESSADLITPSDNIELIQRAIPGITVIQLDGVGHFPMIEAPDQLIEALNSILGEL